MSSNPNHLIVTTETINIFSNFNNMLTNFFFFGTMLTIILINNMLTKMLPLFHSLTLFSLPSKKKTLFSLSQIFNAL